MTFHTPNCRCLNCERTHRRLFDKQAKRIVPISAAVTLLLVAATFLA